MAQPTFWDRLALAGLTGGISVVLLSACMGPTTVIGRESTARTRLTGLQQKTQAPATRQLLVKYKAEMAATEMNALRTMFRLRNVGRIAGIGVYVEEVADGVSVLDTLRVLKTSPAIEYAELNGEVSIGAN